MPGILNNPAGLLAICLVAVLVIGVNATLFTAWRRGLSGDSDARRWRQALGSGLAGQRRQNAQLDELHRAVGQLAAGPTADERAHE